MIDNEKDDGDASELDASFFGDAILVRPGESLLEVVQRERGDEASGLAARDGASVLGSSDEG